jgi:hypothetical protein
MWESPDKHMLALGLQLTVAHSSVFRCQQKMVIIFLCSAAAAINPERRNQLFAA